MKHQSRTAAGAIALAWLVLVWNEAPIADSPSHDRGVSATSDERAVAAAERAVRAADHAGEGRGATLGDAESARIRLRPEPEMRADGDAARAR